MIARVKLEMAGGKGMALDSQLSSADFCDALRAVVGRFAEVELSRCPWCNRPLGNHRTKGAYTPECCSRACEFSFYRYLFPGGKRNCRRLLRFYLDGLMCQQCGYRPRLKAKPWLPDLSELHIDHIKPRSKGGWDIWRNTQTLCQDCNLRKYNHWDGDM